MKVSTQLPIRFDLFDFLNDIIALKYLSVNTKISYVPYFK